MFILPMYFKLSQFTTQHLTQRNKSFHTKSNEREENLFRLFIVYLPSSCSAAAKTVGT